MLILSSMGGDGTDGNARLVGATDAVPIEVQLSLFSRYLHHMGSGVEKRSTGWGIRARPRSELAALAGAVGRGSRGRGAAMRLGTPGTGPLGIYRNWTLKPDKARDCFYPQTHARSHPARRRRRLMPFTSASWCRTRGRRRRPIRATRCARPPSGKWQRRRRGGATSGGPSSPAAKRTSRARPTTRR